MKIYLSLHNSIKHNITYTLFVQYTQVIEMMAEVIKAKLEYLPLDISVSLEHTHQYIHTTCTYTQHHKYYTLYTTCIYTLQSLANKHREINEGHVVALLAMRGDMNKAQVTKVSFTTPHHTHTLILAHTHLPTYLLKRTLKTDTLTLIYTCVHTCSNPLTH